jgi:formylglycine-generating enzyme required for sulfatase activity
LAARLRRLELHGNDLDALTAQAVAGHCPAPPAPGGLPRRLVNSAGIPLALIPAGTTLVGTPPDEVNRYEDEGPQHPATITRPFYLGIFPVTQRQYLDVMGTNPSSFNPAHGGGLDHPVDTVSWEDAGEFCRRLTARPEEQQSGRVYRLPTEAEWEHACRAGTLTPFWFGEAISARQANFDSTAPYGRPAEDLYRERTIVVGAFAPNPFGLYDVHGNVWEWCADWYSATYSQASAAVDPPGPDQDMGQSKVMRGGSWFSTGRGCRSGHRGLSVPRERNHTNGFRVAMTADSPHG